MTWAVRQYSHKDVDAAGAWLVQSTKPRSAEEWEEYLIAGLHRYEGPLGVINNWRSAHSFPLNTFQIGLRHKSRQVDPNPLVAQRIKRLSSIKDKLLRMKRLTLSEMQDIGGCRAVVKSVRHVRQLVKLYKDSQIKHKLIRENDYLCEHKKSGYRGYHLIYRYYSDRSRSYNGLQIEVQLRTPHQHAWATAVETVGTFTRQALKSSRGEQEWLRFFCLMGTALAHEEGTPPVPGTPLDRQGLVQEIKRLANQLEVVRRLRSYGAALQTLEDESTSKAHYFLIALDPDAETVTVTGFKFSELQKASERYLATEQQISGKGVADAVLVSADSMTALRRAYPNYWLDTSVFLDAVARVLA